MKRTSSERRAASGEYLKYSWLAACCLLLASGCNKNPFDRTQNASGGGPTGSFTGANSFVIFNNELTSGGGAFEFPGSDGQSLSFNDMSNPISHRSIRYSWTGQLVAGQNFAGVDLMHTPTIDTYASTPGRDLHLAGYNKVTFFARGSLSTHTSVKIEVADDGNTSTADPCITLSSNASVDHCSDSVADPLAMTPGTLTSSWQQYTITVPNSALTSIKDFFKATFVFVPSIGAPTGQGGTVYFDVIQYQP